MKIRHQIEPIDGFYHNFGSTRSRHVCKAKNIKKNRQRLKALYISKSPRRDASLKRSKTFQPFVQIPKTFFLNSGYHYEHESLWHMKITYIFHVKSPNKADGFQKKDLRPPFHLCGFLGYISTGLSAEK